MDNNLNYYIAKQNCNKLYFLFVKYKDLDYNSFIKKISVAFNKKITISEINSYISFMRTHLSCYKSEVMDDILKLTIARRINDKKTIETITTKLDNKELMPKGGIDLSKTGKASLTSKSFNSVNDLKKVIETKKTVKELYNEGQIETPYVNQFVKKQLNKIDNDDYIEYLRINNKLNATSLKELNQFLEVIEFFINNMEKRLQLLKSYNPKTDAEKIKELYVSGEEDLSSFYKDNAKKLLNWKCTVIINKITRYKTLSDNIKLIINSKNIKDLEQLSTSDKEKINEDEYFVVDYYTDLYNIKKAYNGNVDGLNSVNDERKESIKNDYNKKLIFGNN